MTYAFTFCHGFGFDSSFWNRLKTYFQNYACTFRDVGYFSDPICSQNYPHPMMHIGVGHSLGLLKLLNDDQSIHYDAYVGINSFFNFLGQGSDLYPQRLYEWKVFSENFCKNPNLTLKNFYKRCGVVDAMSSVPSDDGIIRARHDIQMLRHRVDIPHDKPILMLHARNDPVMPHALQMQDCDSCIVHQSCPTGFHALPQHDPQWCYEAIMAWCACMTHSTLNALK